MGGGMKKTNETSKFQTQIGKGGCTYKSGTTLACQKYKYTCKIFFIYNYI